MKHVTVIWQGVELTVAGHYEAGQPDYLPSNPDHAEQGYGSEFEVREIWIEAPDSQGIESTEPVRQWALEWAETACAEIAELSCAVCDNEVSEYDE